MPGLSNLFHFSEDKLKEEMADTLKFGPEWLRQLSGGNSVSTPPPSPAPGFGKYKLAEYRYGREEMLALFTPSQKMPEELAEFSAIITEKAQDPLALLPLTEEEQRFTSQSVNSQAVLRMMGRGAPPLRGRGGGFERGRGRGRGRGDGFMQRGMSYEEGEGGFGRPRGPRPEGWEEMGQKRFDRSFPSHYDESGNPQNPKMYQRSLSSDNWRDREEDDDNGDWRKAGGSKWNTRGNWRDGRERAFDYERNPNLQKGFTRQYQRSRSSESWEEEEMPEWSTDADMDELGTFDASGAFVSTHSKHHFKVRRPHGEGEHVEVEGEQIKPSNSPETAKESQKQQKEKPPEKSSNEEKDINENHMKKVDSKKLVKNSDSPRQSPQTTQSSQSSPRPNSVPTKEKDKNKEKLKTEKPKEADKSENTLPNNTKANSVIVTPDAKQLSDKAPVKKAADKTEKNADNSAIQRDIKVPENSRSTSETSKRKSKQKSEAEALDQLQETVETMVAGMTVEEDECREEEVIVPSAPTAGALPPDHENYNKWFYRDPQGDLQGPFSCKEMAEWFSAGYFTMTLQVRRGCDEVFSPLGELIKHWGRVPFLPGQSPPPAMGKSQPSPDVKQQQQQQQRRDHEQMQALQNFLFQQQLQQQQQIIRQLQLQQIQQMVVRLQENDEVKALPLFQQQQLAMQMLLKHPQQLVMNQPLPQQKLSPRSPEQQTDVNPPTSKPSYPGSFNQEPSSIWDIEPAKSETENELQARLQKELEEKDEYERRLQKKEEELKKRLEEMEREKQEVEKKKLELQRLEEEKKKQEELQRKQEEEKRRQVEEERKRQEEEKRRKEEEKRRQLELERQQEIKRQQELQKQQEAQRLKEQEELEKQKQLEIQRRQQEIQKQQELQQQEALRKQQQEALQKLQQDQLASMKLPSRAQWGASQNNIPAQGQKSLLEIQQQEELERQELEKMQRQQAEIQRQQMLALQQQQQQQKSWTNSFIKPQANPTKSLLEIQDEQARQLERERQKREENQQQAAKNMSLGAASVWNTSPTMASNWANDGAWGALKQSAQMNKSNNSNSLGFWDDAIISTSAPLPVHQNKKQSNKQGKQSADFPALGGGSGNKTKQTQQTKQKPSKSRKEEEAVQRLFQSVKPVDDFTEWCEGQLKSMDTSVDIPTFVAFLQEVESPYEVHDYVRSYLGESKSATEFAKSFLEKRSQYKNKGRPVEEDSIWGPAPAITPRELRQPISEENQKGKGGKKKKNRMMKLDASILGFTVHAAPDRMVGEIDSEMSGGSAR